MDEQSLLNTDKDASWQLNALTEALGDLKVTISDSLSVGRGSDNDVVLGSKEVSRNHALLSILNDELYVKDLASSNGTFVNNERIESNQSTLLNLNDTLGFASFNFTVLQSEAVTNVDADSANDVSTAAMSDANTSSDAQSDIEALSVGVESAMATDSVGDSITSAEPAIVQDTVVEEAVVEEAVIDDVVLDAIVLDEIVLEQDVAKEDSATSASLTDNKTEQPIVKETIIKEVLASSDPVNNTLDNESAVSNTVLNSSAPAVAAAMATDSTTPASTLNTEIEQKKVINEIPKSPLVEEMPVTAPTAQKPVVNEPVVSESLTTAPVTDEEPLMHDRAKPQESVVSPEHDKTTTTALQEEADPDVLRAKQAATGQFSGTANLGTGRDLGTEGNNAMDQALTNQANAGVEDKKPSGGWFIWVFVALIIIGIALWLFNMGGA